MKARVVRSFLIFAIVSGGLVVMSCSTGPAPPEIGTPAYYWSAAKETYAAGDYLKASEHLENLAKTENQYTARALPWDLILTSGMAKGYADLADDFEYGSKANRANPTPFRRQMGEFRKYASTLALQFAHSFNTFEKTNKDPKIALDFTFPTGSALSHPQLSKIGNGELLAPGVVDDIRRSTLQTGVLMATCRAVGAPDDVAKSQDIFKAGNVQVPREVFLLEMANVLYEQSQLFGRTKLDMPERAQFFLTQASDALKQVPEGKDTKALMEKIQKALKSAKSK
jgi:hypothetical protein